MGKVIRIIRPENPRPWISPKWSPWIMLALIVFVIIPCIMLVLATVTIR